MRLVPCLPRCCHYRRLWVCLVCSLVLALGKWVGREVGRGDWRGWGKDRRQVEKGREGRMGAERRLGLLCLLDQPVMGQMPRQFYVNQTVREWGTSLLPVTCFGVVAGHIKEELGPCETLQEDKAKATFRKRNR